jgi:hypothetical protein
MRPIELILSKLPQATRSSAGYRAPCPAHGGDNPTALSITEGEHGAVRLHCFSRDCTQESVLAAIGLTWADCFPESDQRRHRPRPKPEPQPSMNGQRIDAKKLTLTTAVAEAVALILGPAPKYPTDLELLAPYSGLLEELWDIYTDQGTHEAVQVAYIGMREDLEATAPKLFHALERRLRHRQGEPTPAASGPIPHTVSGTQLDLQKGRCDVTR